MPDTPGPSADTSAAKQAGWLLHLLKFAPLPILALGGWAAGLDGLGIVWLFGKWALSILAIGILFVLSPVDMQSRRVQTFMVAYKLLAAIVLVSFD